MNIPDNILEGLINIWRQIGKVSKMTVYNRSMEPTIRKGATIVVAHCINELSVGDIVVFKNIDHLTVHRVVKISKNRKANRLVITKGDANKNLDPPVREDLILGKVIKIENHEA